MKAAILPAQGVPLDVRSDVEVEEPHAGELLIRLVASGVCHSDLSVCNGTIPAQFPVVLGHEGAGVVEAVGDDVGGFDVGDHVVLSWIAQCGECLSCRSGQGYLCRQAVNGLARGTLLDGGSRLSWGGAPVYQMTGLGTFAEHAVVPAIAAVKIPLDVPLETACLFGCAVLTGVGAALNTADIREGDAVAVIGCGGVGLNILQGARIAGAAEIIAVDTNDDKLELARRFGATSTVLGGEDLVASVRALTDRRGADVVFEAIGTMPTIRMAIAATRRGGQTILVGMPAYDAELTLAPTADLIMTARTVKGCWYGSANVQRDIPRLVQLQQENRLQVDELISATIELEDINAALAALESGKVARTIIRY